MKNQTAQEAISDEAYMEGYRRATKVADKKYNALKVLAKEFFDIYESAYGEPDELSPDNANYFKLRKLLNS